MPSKRKHGLTLPGYNYLGPFNSEDNGEPRNHSDRVAKRHDAGYTKLLQRGHNPYLEYNDADEEADSQWGSDYGGRIAFAAFRVKRLASKIGLIRDSTTKRQKLSLTNSPAKAEAPQLGTEVKVMSKTTPQGSGNDSGLKETPIDDVWNVSRGPPSYTFASLPFLQSGDRGVSVRSFDFVARMTSPYDPLVTIATQDTNIGGGTQIQYAPLVDASDTSILSARWYNFYSSIYNFYHVVSCRWHMTIENKMNEPLWVHEMYSNDDIPPLGATNDDIQCWTDAKSHYVGPLANAILSGGQRESNEGAATINDEDETMVQSVGNYETGNHVVSRGPSNIITLSGEYKPGQFTREIHLDSEVENWTAVNANPSLTERLFFRFMHDNNAFDDSSAVSTIRDMYFKYSFKAEYLVEFKELKNGLRRPVSRQPISFTPDQSVTSIS